ncbi:MAG TPA: hypothetical protein VHK24_14620 [Steroidobacter sp.]|jgi:hypothetical protein|nr:hypothetical protein [Steroidobacter sp.]
MGMGIILWFALSILAGVFASNRGFSFIATFLLSLILSPLVGFISVLVRKPRPTEAERAAAAAEVAASKRCPYCAEIIKREAVVCRFCDRRIPVPAEIAMPATAAEEEALMAQLGITYDGDQYCFQSHRYERLRDAIAYASSSAR